MGVGAPLRGFDRAAEFFAAEPAVFVSVAPAAATVGTAFGSHGQSEESAALLSPEASAEADEGLATSSCASVEALPVSGDFADSSAVSDVSGRESVDATSGSGCPRRDDTAAASAATPSDAPLSGAACVETAASAPLSVASVGKSTDSAAAGDSGPRAVAGSFAPAVASLVSGDSADSCDDESVEAFRPVGSLLMIPSEFGCA
ncbi:hypothetical protein [Nocardia lijiangensis]|uniref:hypothetical protein n=1 Tax=Nocardia lijiangensis TaxID=299618 RepID=UPI003D72C5A0